jgi:hypothetical protein
MENIVETGGPIPPVRSFNSYYLLSPLLLTLLAQLFLVACQLQPSAAKPDYGVKLTYRQNQPLRFPDFTLEYIGQRHEESEVFKRGFTFYDFKVTGGAEEQIVSWSSGTGDIGPANFQLAGQTYLLEKSYSDKLGRLAENEVVIWKQ